MVEKLKAPSTTEQKLLSLEGATELFFPAFGDLWSSSWSPFLVVGPWRSLIWCFAVTLQSRLGDGWGFSAQAGSRRGSKARPCRTIIAESKFFLFFCWNDSRFRKNQVGLLCLEAVSLF